jgi:hypothetical protein
MSRRIVYVFAITACAAFVVPASADRECFESSCRMPEVLQAQEAQEVQPEVTAEPAAANAAAAAAPLADSQQASSDAPVVPSVEKPQATASSKPAVSHPAPPSEAAVVEQLPSRAQTPKTAAVPKPASDAIKPQMVVDRSPPALKPLSFAPHEPVRAPTRAAGRADNEVGTQPAAVASRDYAASEAGYSVTAYGPPRHAQPDARVIVVTPAYSYGDDGVATVHKRNDPSWKLCQTEHGRRDTTCSPYQYHAFGEYGYRPLGSYRTQRAVPVGVYVPNARIVAVNE